MGELSPKLRDALGHVDAEWTSERADQTWRGLRVKRTRRAVVRGGAAAVAVALVAGGAYWLARDGAVGTSTDPSTPRVADTTPQPDVTPLPPEPAPEITPLVVLDDGTVVTAAESAEAAEVEVVADAGDRAEVRVVRGKTTFKSPRTPEREFHVVSGDVRIDVYATEFSVARYEGSTEVWAGEGVLRIEWQGKTQEVRAGEHAKFPPDAIEMPPAIMDTATKRPRTVRERVDLLLREADELRKRQQPRRALRPLGRVLKEYPRDPRAHLAAFTLGRVLLEDLDEPRKAARMFQRARKMAPRSPVAEDALAREAEAWAEAGNSDMARDRAEQYLEKYPDGHKVRAVRQYVE